MPTGRARWSACTTPIWKTLPAGTRDAPSPGIADGSSEPACDAVTASELFSDDFSQDVLVQGEIGHETLQARILITQLTQLPDLGQPQPRVLLAPKVEARLAHSQLPT